MWTPNPVNRQIPGPTSTLLSQDETSRHWSFTAFEWIVRDVQKLRDFVERTDFEGGSDDRLSGADAGREDFEILKESPMLGDGKFKLEIGRSATPVSSSTPPDVPTLSLYVTSLMLDYANAEYEISASMLAAIKCQDDQVGERGARADWAWEFWQNDWSFRQENEVWECPLPSLSSLLENPRIAQTDSFVICIQIHTPIGPFFPQHPSAYFVPRDLLDGLEALLDNSNTGDVQFICLERMPSEQSQAALPPSTPPHTANSDSRRSSSSSSHSFQPRITARKRVIYAHSDILTRRSEYFSTMLSSAFSENSQSGDRKMYTVVVEEADFVTIYWLLKWVYANWLLLAKYDDPRTAVEGVGAGWSAKWLNTRGVADEWDWKTFSKTHPIDELSAGGSESARSSAGGLAAGEEQPNFPSGLQMRQPIERTPSTSKPPQSSPSSSRTTASTASRRGAAPPTTSQAASTRGKSAPITIPVPPHHPLSPRGQRQHSHSVVPSSTDPHKHPTEAPPPASALSVYQVAHRYRMEGLANLALEHMMSTITPQTSFALLLATAIYDELHSLIEDYIVEKWDEVSVSEDMERCCEEVAAGEWGSEGGKTLMALFRRLRSPGYTRT
ncbi:hypothetical protein DENSPDRAFT_768178 [Dentipellis sp. KUC8613]|nr:hypothetical protein DENSPDRAFT_768178 [Dentipellis sp. KUC8613]